MEEDIDMSDEDGEENDYSMPQDLPDGVQKEITTEAHKDNWQKPKQGDEVTVHYVGTLQSDGTEFDSSRKRDKPFVFSLGKGQVIKGWDLGVATMKKGEVAKFTLSPQFAYGDAGSPPKIPEKATLVFEIELISWASKDDLFRDEGAIKTLLTEGSGWQSPKTGDEVLISVIVTKEDGTVILSKQDLEYVLGSGTLGVCQSVCDKALAGMKRGEESSVKCSKEYADGLEGGATVQIMLKEMFKTDDVSPHKDKTMIKKQVKDGEGYDKPKDGAKGKLSVETATNGSTAIPCFTPKVLEFIAGNGEVCDALEFAVAEMKKGERAIVTVKTPSLAAEAQLGLKDMSADKVVFSLELQDYEKAKETYDMSEEEKVEFAVARKDVGANLFKAGRSSMALQRYKRVVDCFSYIDGIKDENNKNKAKELKKACELNKAACYLKLEDYIEAKKACEAVLKDEASNVKAIYRRAQAYLALKEFPECMRDCKKVVELDAQNRDARSLIKQAQAGQKEEDKKSKGLFANMCKALGKGPIPEPFVAKKSQEDGMDSEDDEDGATMDMEASEMAASMEKQDATEDAQMTGAEEVTTTPTAPAA